MDPGISDETLIAEALAVVNPRQVAGYTIGDVGCALLSASGRIYRGVCIDTSSSLGFCAEHSAIAAMITAGEYRIKAIVAACRDERGAYILAPCGRCREFMHQIDPGNLGARVILARDHALTLAELLPYHDSFQPIERP